MTSTRPSRYRVGRLLPWCAIATLLALAATPGVALGAAPTTTAPAARAAATAGAAQTPGTDSDGPQPPTAGPDRGRDPSRRARRPPHRHDRGADGTPRPRDIPHRPLGPRGDPSAAQTPDTDTPDTDGPESDAPEDSAPEDSTPDTDPPETDAPETDAPESPAPEPAAPEPAAAQPPARAVPARPPVRTPPQALRPQQPEQPAPPSVPAPRTPAAPLPAPSPTETAPAQPRDRTDAARRAADLAADAASVRASWESHGQPRRMVILRPSNIDLVADGQLMRRQPFPGHAVISTLDRYLPSSWLTVAGNTATLSAAVVLTPGAVLDSGGDVRTLKLVGGATPGDAASLYTGGGRLILRGVSVTSADPGSQQPLPPTAAGRPAIVVSARGRLEATDATISDLGTQPIGIDQGRAGVLFNPDSSGSLIRTTLARNSTGVELSGSVGVQLQDVTASDSMADGVVLRGDRGTTMSGIRATGNGGSGVLVTGVSSSRPVTGVSTTGNGDYGVAVVGQQGARITGVTTASDKGGGMHLSRSTNSVITDFTATDQPIGLFIHVDSNGTVVDRMRSTGGLRGMVIEKTTHGLDVRESTFTGAEVAGIAVGGHQVQLDAVQVDDSRTGVRVERGASDVAITGVLVNHGHDGIVTAEGTSGVVVTDMTVNHVASDGVRTFTPDTRIVGGRIVGGSTGIDAAAVTSISGTSIGSVRQGIYSRSTGSVRADRVSVDAIDTGVYAAAGSSVQLSNSRVHALEAIRGVVGQQGINDLSLPPLNLLGAIGVPVILLAILLEMVHAVRQRRVTAARLRPRPGPKHRLPPPQRAGRQLAGSSLSGPGSHQGPDQ
ncbi:right-handed parallel beta-helix repeat-containing protein [Pseudonocardia xinjiangensis]|uniref:right-handed parallel beta-helix repeat-containing protein n=1 Tax=Pseudonocardia xinjiangensis TaxID=75289 RepID=UPI003D8A45F6